MFRASSLIAFGLVSLLLVAGCGPKVIKPKLAPVKGMVNLDGQPMASGEVNFVIVGKHTAVLPVTNGSFSGEAAVGENRVEVYSYTVGGDVVEMGGQKFGGEKVNSIPAQWNSMTTLKATVAEQGPNESKFDVTSK